MRNFILGLSVFLFVLSGVVVYKTINLPSKNTCYQNNSQEIKLKELSPKTSDILEKSSKEQSVDRTLVKKLQSANTKLENKTDKNKKSQTKVDNKGDLKKARGLGVFGDGAFRSGQYVINDNLKASVQNLIKDIKASPDHRIIIEGHTDNEIPSTGKRYTDNIELSYLRANAIADLLVKNGVPPERISVIGYGDTRPADSNNTVEGRAKNRRVEVKLIPADKDF